MSANLTSDRGSHDVPGVTGSPTPTGIVQAALTAATLRDAQGVQAMIQTAFGGPGYYRPLADTWNNHGLVGSSGSYDHKLIELVTNMQDAVLERAALSRYGRHGEIPYTSPHEASTDLFAGLDEAQLAARATVTLKESDPPATKTKRLTAVFRDRGCGLTPEQIPRTIFRIGGSHKEEALYLQGAFGMGGAMTYRNAAAVVLVTRRDPQLLEDDEADLISVAVVEWRLNTKGSTAMYLVDQPWDGPGDLAEPWSCPAADVPDFEPGTHLALISYRTDGIQRKTERDVASFNTVADTRLYDPVLPVRFTNETDRGRNTVLRGLQRRLTSARTTSLPTDTETLPFRVDGQTHHLPVTFVLFEAKKDTGGIDKFVAGGHAVIFTSNGQAHHHWSSAELKQKTGFNKIHDRVLVIVDTDELPIRVRTSLFTADRNDMVRTDAAIRLEEAVAGFLKDWDALAEQNNLLLRESLRAGSDAASADVGRRIGRAFGAATGYSPTVAGRGTDGGSGGGGGGRSRHRKIDLHPDPTKVEGPNEIRVRRDLIRSVSFVVDAVDEFWNGRGTLSVTTDHPDIGPRDITLGRGRAGRVRVMVAVPDVAALGTFELTAILADWHRAGGGLGPELSWTIKMEVVDDLPPHPGGPGSGAGRRGPVGSGGPGGATAGHDVVVKWSSHERNDDWEKMTVGDVNDVEAHVVASEVNGYSELAALGSTRIPVIQLNEDYPPFKSYLQTRSRTLVNLQRPQEQYAIGVGLALMILRDEAQKRASRGLTGASDPSDTDGAARAAARAVLAVMPSSDEILRQAGVTD